MADREVQGYATPKTLIQRAARNCVTNETAVYEKGQLV
jgi:hypothetical protein